MKTELEKCLAGEPFFGGDPEIAELPDDGSDGCEFCLTYAKPVKICDGAWLGGGVIVLPGVTIGRNSVVGAGSVVTRSVPDNCVAVGNPCRVIKTIDNK